MRQHPHGTHLWCGSIVWTVVVCRRDILVLAGRVETVALGITHVLRRSALVSALIPHIWGALTHYVLIVALDLANSAVNVVVCATFALVCRCITLAIGCLHLTVGHLSLSVGRLPLAVGRLCLAGTVLDIAASALPAFIRRRVALPITASVTSNRRRLTLAKPGVWRVSVLLAVTIARIARDTLAGATHKAVSASVQRTSTLVGTPNETVTGVSAHSPVFASTASTLAKTGIRRRGIVARESTRTRLVPFPIKCECGGLWRDRKSCGCHRKGHTQAYELPTRSVLLHRRSPSPLLMQGPIQNERSKLLRLRDIITYTLE